jgi:DNA-binding IclR family transcriptional regulator
VDGEVSVEVRDFIARHIVSIEQLEVLLLLTETEDRAWTARELNERLRSQEASIAKWLAALQAQKMVTVTDQRFRFAPADVTLRRQVAALAEAYRSRRIKVIELIFSKPNETLRSFVDAFDLRK